MPLTYCLNVHPGESWEENLAVLRSTVLRVRDLVSPGKAFGLGLRLGAAAAATLDDAGRLAEFAEFLKSEDLFVFTVNAFPHGRFHGGRVKENVYAPDWRSGQRREYTNRVATILAGLIPEGETGSISTVPCSWKPWVQSAEDWMPMIANLTDCAAHCADIAARTGRDILLALEPEPGCLLETTAETIEFFNGRLFGEGAALLGAKMGLAVEPARELMRHHMGVCLDTCHVALQFEDPVEALRRYEAEGIRVPKIQISSALRTENTREALDALRPFAEQVYLHQVKARSAEGTIFGWNDLPEALEEIPKTEAEEVRIHFHVPLHFEGSGALGSTGTLLTAEFLTGMGRDPSRHLEIETYTWEVLPQELKWASMDQSIAAEFFWLERFLGV